MMRKLLCLLAFIAVPAHAQEATSANGAVLRALDKVSGAARDVEITRGQSVEIGSLTVQLNDCRFPVGNPSGDAYAELEITESGGDGRLFSGWMIASSPALSALEHPRYDVWVIRCTTS
jgi:hypothetical protein|tara:strand:+ start:2686 stop:3042 length:357 start_codon:yes stop_codon:yes gene_type:complete